MPSSFSSVSIVLFLLITKVLHLWMIIGIVHATNNKTLDLIVYFGEGASLTTARLFNITLEYEKHKKQTCEDFGNILNFLVILQLFDWVG